jgi:hypothetical protein
LQRSSAVYGKPGNVYALVPVTKGVLVEGKQEDGVIGLKNNKND